MRSTLSKERDREMILTTIGKVLGSEFHLGLEKSFLPKIKVTWSRWMTVCSGRVTLVEKRVTDLDLYGEDVMVEGRVLWEYQKKWCPDSKEFLPRIRDEGERVVGEWYIKEPCTYRLIWSSLQFSCQDSNTGCISCNILEPFL